ncbi:MAG: cell division protein FtsQ/DivIB [Kiritimatiellia bacterium]
MRAGKTRKEEIDLAYGHPERRRKNRPRESVLKVAARSAERRRTLGRRIGGALVLLVGIPAVLAGLVFGGRAAWLGLFEENDFFRIRRIEVTTDGNLGAGHVREYAKVKEGMNLFAVSPQAVRESLLSVPVIAHAQVGRRLPDTLVIEVAERVAVARLGRPGSGSPLAVDAAGHVLGPSSVRPSLPAILGVRDNGLRPGDAVKDPMLQDALKVLVLCNQSELREAMSVETIDLANEEYLVVGLKTGERVLLSGPQWADKLVQLRAMLDVARDRGLGLAEYDMTVDQNFVGRPAGMVSSAETDAAARIE